MLLPLQIAQQRCEYPSLYPLLIVGFPARNQQHKQGHFFLLWSLLSSSEPLAFSRFQNLVSAPYFASDAHRNVTAHLEQGISTTAHLCATALVAKGKGIALSSMHRGLEEVKVFVSTDCQGTVLQLLSLESFRNTPQHLCSPFIRKQKNVDTYTYTQVPYKGSELGSSAFLTAKIWHGFGCTWRSPRTSTVSCFPVLQEASYSLVF